MKTVAQEKVKHRVSGPAQRTGRGRKVAKVVLQESGGFIKIVVVLSMLPIAEGRLGVSVLSTSTTM